MIYSILHVKAGAINLKTVDNNDFGLIKNRWYAIPVIIVVLGIGMASGVQRAALALYARDFSGKEQYLKKNQ